ncbi:NAD-dependent epimerase/dehydratase family protein [Spongiimicrobium salis]|uniref:NAD-dependent epimerase/dehydratase family protein n=1 Tax=Spongiimicrobium salis TaxID=1667022 RepID=UPI00374DFA70
MQTILGANGIIGEELAKALRKKYTSNISLVGRNPKKVHPEDELVIADLLDPEHLKIALKQTEIAYLTVGLPYSSEIWLRDWPKILQNVVEACKAQQCKLVYFDNTYAYPQDSHIQIEETVLAPKGKKGKAKKIAVQFVLEAINNQEIEAVICRAPEFYGPGKTKSITNTLIFDPIKKGKKPKVFLRDDVLRTLIYTPDASAAMALLGNTPEVYGETWHLPCDDQRLTYKQFIAEISRQLKREIPYTILNTLTLKIASFFNANARETQELLPRYRQDNIFDSSKFKKRFPNFEVTPYAKGIQTILSEML